MTKIDDKLYQDIKQFCYLNRIKINSFINELLKKAFNREKYGDAPFGATTPKITTKVNVDELSYPYNEPINANAKIEEMFIENKPNKKEEEKKIVVEKNLTDTKIKKRKLN